MMLYAAQFKDGRIKIGATSNMVRRLSHLRHSYRSDVVRHTYVGPIVGRMIEAAAHRTAERLCSARHGEVFFGLKFGEASGIIRQVVRRQDEIAVKHYADCKRKRREAYKPWWVSA